MNRIPKYVLPLSVVGSIVGGVVIFKDSFGGARYKGEDKVAGRTIIITGANSGLGKETAHELARRGGRILMACRNLEKCEEVRQAIIEDTFNKNVHCKKLDLASLDSIRQFADDINKNEKRLDILVNNAGVMGIEKVLTRDGFELMLGVNYLGPFLLSHLLLDKLKKSQPSRIINVTTAIYSKGRIDFRDLNSAKNYDYQQAYKQSKLAIIMFTVELAKRLQGTDVTVNVVNPGLADTNLGRHLRMNQSMISHYASRPIWWLVFKTPVQAIQTLLYAALDPDLGVASGKYLEECRELPIAQMALSQGRIERLWAISEVWVGLKERTTEPVRDTDGHS